MRYWQHSDYDAPRPYSRGWRRYSVATWLIIINAAIFFLQAVVGRLFPNAAIAFFNAFSLLPTDVFRRGFIWQLVTYAFLHASLMHILFNMLFLYMFGSAIEQVWGRQRFLLHYLCAAAFAGLCYSGVFFLVNANIVAVGASGAVMALLMVYALWWPERQILFMLIFPIRMRTFIMIVIAIEVLTLLQVSSGVATLAHLGGLLYGYLIVRKQSLGERWLGAFQRLTARDEEADHRRLDSILDRVHREGMQSLSWSERRFLRRYSRRPR